MVSGLNIEGEESAIDDDVSKRDAQSLQDSYRKIFQTMSEGFVLHEIVYDENGEPYDLRILDANPAFELQTGLRKEDILGRTFKQVLPDEDPLLAKTLGPVALTGKPTKFKTYSRSLGRFYDIIAYSPAPLQVAVLFLDVTKKKESENGFIKIEAMNRAIINSIPYQIFILSDDGSFLDYRSPSGSELYISPGSFLGKKMKDVLPADLVDQIESKMIEARKSEVVQTFEYKLPVNGVEKFYEARIACCSEGTFVALIRNIDERKRMEQTLLENERRFKTAISNFPYTFIIYDRDLRIRHINPAGLEMCGMSEDEILGHTDEELFPSEITEPYMRALRLARETGTLQTLESSQNLPIGRSTIVFNYVPIFDDKNELCQILAINYDISEIKEAKRKLELALEENRAKNRLLKTTVEELSGNYREIEALLFKISRDLMTPLITIEGFLQLLKKDVEKCNRIRIDIDMGLIGDAISRMRILLGDAMEISSLGVLSGSSESIPFEEIIRDIREHFQAKIRSGELAITEDERFPEVFFNRKRMVDVLVSIVDGCIRYSKSPGKSCVHIGWINQDNRPAFFAGCEGIDDLANMSQAFQLFSTEVDKNDDKSIGLAISKRIIELQGGRMWMEHSPETGCSIFFSIPERWTS